MFIFKILLIILIAAPVIALASYFYSQMLGFIREKDRIETEMIENDTFERRRPEDKRESAKKKKTGKSGEKKDKKSGKKKK